MICWTGRQLLIWDVGGVKLLRALAAQRKHPDQRQHRAVSEVCKIRNPRNR
jgi:hypothetical protein